MLTPEELQFLKNRLSQEPLDLSGSSSGDEPGYFERVGKEYMGAAENIISDIKRPAESAAQGASPLEVARQVGETGLRTAGNVAGAVFAPITEAIAPVIKPVIEKIMDNPGVKADAQKIVDWANKNPETAKDLGAVFNIITAAIAAKVVPKVGGVAAGATGGAAESTGGFLKSAGKKLYGISIPMEQSTARAVQAYQAAKPTLFQRIAGYFSGAEKSTLKSPVTEAETAARMGLSGTEWQLGVQAKRAAAGLWDDTIRPALIAAKDKIDIKQFFVDLRDRIISETPDLSRRKLLLKSLESFQKDFKNVSNISLSKLQDYKSGWAKFIPEKVYQGKPIAGALNEVRNMAAQEARSIIYSKLGESVKQAYFDYGNLQSILEAGLKSVDPLRSKSAFRQAWEFVLDKTVTPISTYSGKVLYKTGEGLEFIGKSGAAKVRDIIGS